MSCVSAARRAARTCPRVFAFPFSPLTKSCTAGSCCVRCAHTSSRVKPRVACVPRAPRCVEERSLSFANVYNSGYSVTQTKVYLSVKYLLTYYYSPDHLLLPATFARFPLTRPVGGRCGRLPSRFGDRRRGREPLPAGTLSARPNPGKIYVSAAPEVRHNFLLQVQFV